MTAQPLTPSEKARLRELAGKATPGPWSDYVDNSDQPLVCSTDGSIIAFVVDDVTLDVGANAEFIAACRMAIPSLLDEIEALRVDAELYISACDAVEEWKCRALNAEAELERAVRDAEGSTTFMGEPAICEHQWIMKTSKGGSIDECTICGEIRWHKPISHAPDCNLNMADIRSRLKGCDCAARQKETP